MNSPTCAGHMRFTCWVYRNKTVIPFYDFVPSPGPLLSLLASFPHVALTAPLHITQGFSSWWLCLCFCFIPFALHTHTQFFLCLVYKLALHKNSTYGMKARECWEQYMPECVSMGAMGSVFLGLCLHPLLTSLTQWWAGIWWMNGWMDRETYGPGIKAIHVS